MTPPRKWTLGAGTVCTKPSPLAYVVEGPDLKLGETIHVCEVGETPDETYYKQILRQIADGKYESMAEAKHAARCALDPRWQEFESDLAYRVHHWSLVRSDSQWAWAKNWLRERLK